MTTPLSYEYDRDDYYCYPNSTVLKNKLNITDEKALNDLERKITSAKSSSLEIEPLAGELNSDYLKAIHRYLFEDIYDWAGENRKIDIARGNIFCMHELIDVCLNQVMLELKSENFLANVQRKDFAKRLAYYLGEINTIHPFREGNGRTQRIFIREIARRSGFPLTLDGVSKEEMIMASDKTFNHDYEMMEKLLLKSLFK